LTTSNGVTAKAVTREPIDPERILGSRGDEALPSTMDSAPSIGIFFFGSASIDMMSVLFGILLVGL
jgi:hypothetical protein